MYLSPSILSRLEFQHQTINELIAGSDEHQLTVRTIPGKWSAFEIIAHLSADQLAFKQRIQEILKGNNAVLERYVAENDPLFTEFLQLSLHSLLHDLNSERQLIYQQLQSLEVHQLAFTGEHPKYGRLTLVQWSEFFLLHEAHHLFTIFQ